jgi:hypothetical protein
MGCKRWAVAQLFRVYANFILKVKGPLELEKNRISRKRGNGGGGNKVGGDRGGLGKCTVNIEEEKVRRDIWRYGKER